MNFKFSEKINNFLKIILKNALSQNIRVFFVGGIVRDNILNIPTFDIDLLITDNAIEFAKKLPQEIKINSIHKDFCTAKIQYDNIEIDIASSRSENYPHSGCLPVLNEIGIPIEKDVSRRDFSVNSIYCELTLENNNIHYTVIDLVNGINDIKNKTLKVLHNKSYVDDPTRIIRGLGFKYRFGFDFSANDKKLIKEYLNNINYENMSLARNEKVIKKVLNSQFQFDIFKELIKEKYYKIINSKELIVDFELIEKIFDIFSLDMISMTELYIKIIYDVNIEKYNLKKPVDIYKTFSNFNLIDLAYYHYKTKDENALKYLTYKTISLKITGEDLLKLGYKQGKLIGIMLDELLNEKLQNQDYFKTKSKELDWILKNYPKN